MPTSPRRKLGLFDAMILVAAAAIGALSLRLFRLYGLERLPIYRDMYPGYEATPYLGIVLKFVGPWLASFTLALLMIRLRGARPPLRRLLRQPGATACLAATMILALEALLAALDFAILGLPAGDDFHYKFLPLIVEGPAAGVSAVWFIQALGRRWCPEPSWIDRFGRAVGVCWVLLLGLGFWDVFWSTSVELRFRPPRLSNAQIVAEDEQRQVIREQLQTYEIELEKETAALQKELAELERRRRELSPKSSGPPGEQGSKTP